MSDWSEPFELDEDHMERVRESRQYKPRANQQKPGSGRMWGTGGREGIDYHTVNDGWLSRRIYKKPLDLS